MLLSRLSARCFSLGVSLSVFLPRCIIQALVIKTPGESLDDYYRPLSVFFARTMFLSRHIIGGRQKIHPHDKIVTFNKIKTGERKTEAHAKHVRYYSGCDIRRAFSRYYFVVLTGNSFRRRANTIIADTCSCSHRAVRRKHEGGR